MLIRGTLALAALALILVFGVFRDRPWQLGVWIGVALAFAVLWSLCDEYDQRRVRRLR